MSIRRVKGLFPQNPEYCRRCSDLLMPLIATKSCVRLAWCDPFGAYSTATLTAGFNIDIKNPLQTLGPGHRHVVFQRWRFLSLRGSFAFLAFASLRRSDQSSMLTVGCKHSMKPREVDARSGNQCDEPGNEMRCEGVWCLRYRNLYTSNYVMDWYDRLEKVLNTWVHHEERVRAKGLLRNS